MPRLKDFEDVDVDELEDAEYTEGGDWQRYDGETPPKGTFLSGNIKKLWLRQDKSGNPMLVALFEASDNEGDTEEFNGWSRMEYMSLTTTAKFRWGPFFAVTGLRIRDLIGPKSNLWVEEEDDNIGTPIEKVGKWVPGPDNDDAWVRVTTDIETKKGDYYGQAKVGSWHHWDDAIPEAPEEEPEDEPEDEPDEVEEPEPTPTRAARTRSSGTTARKPGSKAATAEPAAPVPAARSRSRAPAAKAATAATKPAGRSRRGGAAQEEPPF